MSEEESRLSTSPIDETLTRVVLLMRLLGWVWMVALALTELMDEVTPPQNPTVLIGAIGVATVGTVLMLVASRVSFLGAWGYVALDGAMTGYLLLSGWLAGIPEFVAGGIPMSWLFLAAYASRLEIVAIASLALTGFYAWLHDLMDLGAVRMVGSIQFLVTGLIVSWAFDALRHRERLRLAAEAEARDAQSKLVAERENVTRLEERSKIARRLHDSLLQTLKLIMSNSTDADEVRYLAPRAGERAETDDQSVPFTL